MSSVSVLSGRVTCKRLGGETVLSVFHTLVSRWRSEDVDNRLMETDKRSTFPSLSWKRLPRGVIARWGPKELSHLVGGVTRVTPQNVQPEIILVGYRP